MATPLLLEIEQFLSESAMSEGYFGWCAAKNWRLLERLRNGRRVWPETEAQVRAFIISERRRRASEQGAVA